MEEYETREMDYDKAREFWKFLDREIGIGLDYEVVETENSDNVYIEIRGLTPEEVLKIREYENSIKE